jgi:RNA polymerase sigma factor (sigma-70 family)
MNEQSSAGPPTSSTLLSRIRDLTSRGDWERFVSLYGPFLERFLRRRGLTPDDALDVVQETFTAVVDHIGDFQYDPERRFRGWLATIALRKAWRHLAQRRREPLGAGGTTHMAAVEAWPDDGHGVSDETDRWEVILDRVRAEISSREWDAFRLTVLEDVECQAAAERLHMQLGHLYVCRSRAKRALQRVLEQGYE